MSESLGAQGGLEGGREAWTLAATETSQTEASSAPPTGTLDSSSLFPSALHSRLSFLIHLVGAGRVSLPSSGWWRLRGW